MRKVLFIFIVMMGTTAWAQSCPDDNHPHKIDLGLPTGTKWSCCNVGANSPDECGGYFVWGETSEKQVYNWTTYLYGHFDSEANHYVGDNIGSSICNTDYDVAHVLWGDTWRMPSDTDVTEFLQNCSYEWTMMNGFQGGKYTGPNGNSIFIPAVGYKEETSFHYYKTGSFCWIGRADSSDPNSAYLFGNDKYNCGWLIYQRDNGLSVRPVAYDDLGIENMKSISSQPVGHTIYDIYGIKVADDVDGMANLPAGIYIVNGKKMVKGNP